MRDLIRLFKFAKSFKLLISIALFLSVSSAIIALINPWLYRELINLLAQEETLVSNLPLKEGLILIVLLFFCVNLIRNILENLQNFISDKMYFQMGAQLSLNAFTNLQKMPLDFFERQHTGIIKKRIEDGALNIQSVIWSIIIKFIPLILKVIIILGIMAYMNLPLLNFFLLMVPLFIFITIWRSRIISDKEEEIRDAEEIRSAKLQETLSQMLTVFSFNRMQWEIKKFQQLTNRVKDLILTQQRFDSWSNFLRLLISDISIVFVIGYGSYLALEGTFKIGDIVLFISYISMLYDPLLEITWIYDKFKQGMRSIRRVFYLVDQKPKIADPPHAKILKGVKYKIEFKNVSFAYPGTEVTKNQYILRGLNFKLKPKEITALVGPSGAGKSTIAKLILRFYDPDEGLILIDKTDIRTFSIASLREKIGFLAQEPVLFDDTILNNLRYARPNATYQEIIQALRRANAYEFIKALPLGLNTLVGERGTKLSGGEKQRISLAQIILKNPPILILDEPVTHLDALSEKLIQESLWQFIKDKTVLIIAHRFSTVTKADKILVLDNGKIIEEATHQELAKKRGLYYKLYKIQKEILV